MQAMPRLLQKNELISSLCDDPRLFPWWWSSVVGGLPRVHVGLRNASKNSRGLREDPPGIPNKKHGENFDSVPTRTLREKIEEEKWQKENQ